MPVQSLGASVGVAFRDRRIELQRPGVPLDERQPEHCDEAAGRWSRTAVLSLYSSFAAGDHWSTRSLSTLFFL